MLLPNVLAMTAADPIVVGQDTPIERVLPQSTAPQRLFRIST
ncbi:MAG: hypothetical protein ACK4K5_08860 [Thermosynechococcus sp.]